MAQLTNTIVNGDLRVTGNIYGNNTVSKCSASYKTNNESTDNRWVKLATGSISGTATSINGDWIVRVCGETFSYDMPFTLNVRTYASGEAPQAFGFLKVNTESSYGYKNGYTGICVVTYGNTPTVSVEVWVRLTYNYASISLIEIASGSRDISAASRWTYSDASGAGSAKPSASGTTRVKNPTVVLVACDEDIEWNNDSGAYTGWGTGNTTTPVYLSEYGQIKTCSPSSMSVGSATTSTYPYGFSSRPSSIDWGTLKTSYTYITDWHTSAGGDVGFAESGGAVSMQIDGLFYQREGANRCIDTSEVDLKSKATIMYNTSTSTIDFNFL